MCNISRHYLALLVLEKDVLRQGLGGKRVEPSRTTTSLNIPMQFLNIFVCYKGVQTRRKTYASSRAFPTSFINNSMNPAKCS